jgi:hypothetical protein
MRGVLGLDRTKPAWFDLPVMMKLTLSTPHHALQNLAKGPLTRPHNFIMIPQTSRFGCPENVDPDKFTLITPFSSERNEWTNSRCINIHDQESPVYELTNEYDGHRALTKNFFMLLDSYQNHPEAKSLGPDGKSCEFDTRGLLQRAHIVANWPPVYIGKESDRHWDEGEDLSLLEFKATEYRPKGKAIATDEQLARIMKVPKREFMRRGINQHTLEKICRREPVRASKLAKCLKVLEELEAESVHIERNWPQQIPHGPTRDAARPLGRCASRDGPGCTSPQTQSSPWSRWPAPSPLDHSASAQTADPSPSA